MTDPKSAVIYRRIRWCVNSSLGWVISGAWCSSIWNNCLIHNTSCISCCINAISRIWSSWISSTNHTWIRTITRFYRLIANTAVCSRIWRRGSIRCSVYLRCRVLGRIRCAIGDRRITGSTGCIGRDTYCWVVCWWCRILTCIICCCIACWCRIRCSLSCTISRVGILALC
jgi:hypothetical protein